jgi:hypothetical protein
MSYPCPKGKWWANVDHTVRDRESYAVVQMLGDKHDTMETARLIAAAPDLLEIAEAYLKLLRDNLRSDDDDDVVMARAAIKKVKGL